MGWLDIQMTAILIARSPEVDPEVNLKVGHLMGPTAPLLLMTESILATGSMMETEVETRTTDLIVDPTILRTVTGTVPAMAGTVMTSFYDFDSRYYGWGYNRRYDDRSEYWSLPHRFPPPPRPDYHCSVNLRDMHPWGDPSFRDR